MSNTNKQKKPDFTIEFKQSAAKLVNEKCYTHHQAADSLGVSLSALGRWVRAGHFPLVAYRWEGEFVLRKSGFRFVRSYNTNLIDTVN